jgi:hypothetical protein
LYGESPIFNLQHRISKADFESHFMELWEDWYPATEDEISLGGGYWDGGILTAVRTRLDESITALLRRAFEQNPFELESEIKDLLATVKGYVSTFIPEGAIYYRARLGVEQRLTPHDIHWEAKRNYVPYSNKDIAQVPVMLATEGRLNRARVSVLYLATDAETAVSELRPHPGHLVSVARFESVRPILIADFANYDLRKYLSDSRLELLRRVLSFSALLNLPIQPDRREFYALTQLLADAIRTSGFEGVAFKSSVAAGTNATCFVPDAFRIVAGSENVVEVGSLVYRLTKRETVEPGFDANNYDVDTDPLSTLYDGFGQSRT